MDSRSLRHPDVSVVVDALPAPGSVGVGCSGCLHEQDPSRSYVDEEEHVQSLQPSSLDGEEHYCADLPKYFFSSEATRE